MGIEVELKAHVSDAYVLKARISSLVGASEGISEHKSDVYWSFPDGEPLFRVREESTGPMDDAPRQGSLKVTRKDKQLQGAIEVNHEIEFTVPLIDADAVDAFCRSLGYVVAVRKEKTGWAWRYRSERLSGPEIHIELIDVTSLGWFLEVECVLPDDAPASSVQEARGVLLALLDVLQVPRSAIEERYYMDMLMGRS
ncbi:MAG: CYTH domain-containing protein [Sphaerochaetaceae bacterium]|jgi:adenylate cyclase class 2